jgi:hypothetical protein
MANAQFPLHVMAGLISSVVEAPVQVRYLITHDGFVAGWVKDGLAYTFEFDAAWSYLPSYEFVDKVKAKLISQPQMQADAHASAA